LEVVGMATNDPAVADVLRHYRADVREAARLACNELRDLGVSDPERLLAPRPPRSDRRRSGDVRGTRPPARDGNVIGLMAWLEESVRQRGPSPA
jgi:hypothetical protein